MTFITKKHMSRRTVLRGAGATLALPLLDAMIPASTALAQTAATPKPRFVGCFVPHGAAPGYWSPLKEGRDFDFSFITKPLEPFRSRTVLITGLDMPEAMATDDEGHVTAAGLVDTAAEGRCPVVRGGSPAAAHFLRLTLDKLRPALFAEQLVAVAEYTEAIATLEDPGSTIVMPMTVAAWGTRP